MKQVVLDTSSLVRFFTNDIPDKAIKVKKLILSGLNLYVPDVVLIELEYVLSGKIYKLERSAIVKILEYLAISPNISITTTAQKAILLYKISRLDLGDCFVAAHALEKGKLFTFDKKLANLYEKGKKLDI